MNKFLNFEDVSVIGQKTKKYNITSSHDGSYLGYIYWRNGWRRYVMHFSNDCDWSIECMAECYKFIAKLMQDRKEGIVEKNRDNNLCERIGKR